MFLSVASSVWPATAPPTMHVHTHTRPHTCCVPTAAMVWCGAVGEFGGGSEGKGGAGEQKSTRAKWALLAVGEESDLTHCGQRWEPHGDSD